MNRERVAWWGILGGAVLLRLVLYSGYGLGDDPNFFLAYHGIYQSGSIDPTFSYDFRFAFWIPVVLFMKIFGVTEWGFVGFVTVCSVVNVMLAHAIARQEWDERSALLAMALAAVLPVEVLSSTLFVIDIPVATYCYTAFWLYRRALMRQRVAPAILAGVFLLLSYSAKKWGLLVGLLFAFEGLRHLRTGWRYSAWCASTFAALALLYSAWQRHRFGDPFYDVRVERSVSIFLPLSREIALDYSKMLFLPNAYGSWFAGWYPHLLALLAVLFIHRTVAAGKWLLYFVMELASLSAMPWNRENGHWVLLVPHIFRYLCFLTIPLCVALAGYLRELLRWRPLVGRIAVAGLLLWTVRQAAALTWPTRDAFGEQRRANAFLVSTFPDDVVWSDQGFTGRYQSFVARPPGTTALITKETPREQAVELGRVTDGVVVTGGGRLPWYGCTRCPATIAAFRPPSSWRLVRQFDAPLVPYRSEPLRIWRVSDAGERAEALLRERPDPAARAALVGELLESGDAATALEVGRMLLEGGATGTDVVYLTGLACARAGKPGCATRYLGDLISTGLDQGRLQDALLALVKAEEARGHFDEARAWTDRYRRRFPNGPIRPEIDELESGIAESAWLYQLGRYADARRRFAALRDDAKANVGLRQRAHYFLALTLFRQHDLPEAVRESEAYRAQYGEDPNWIELAFRNAEARREVDPAKARMLFADVAAKYPGTYWADESKRLLERLGAVSASP